jgi:uncharacterized protein (DUF427 family)
LPDPRADPAWQVDAATKDAAMPSAISKGISIAQGGCHASADGNVHLPPEALHAVQFRPLAKTAVCGSKGTARRHDVVVDGQVNPAATWYCPGPKPTAANIRGHVAFWLGVTVGP